MLRCIDQRIRFWRGRNGSKEGWTVKEVFLPRWEDCLEYLRKKRWKEGVKCPYCGSLEIWVDGYTRKGARKYECQAWGGILTI
jgi:predicted RNA-binding Zn-ribbon protein involved in translation (DUF1610 family)